MPLGKMFKGKKKVVLDEKGFCKNKKILKDCSKMEKNRDKDKPSEVSKCYIKLLSRS
jgi:hypothetical protein